MLKRRDDGFSILEVLLATILLGVTIVALSEGITVALRSSKEAERYTVAVLLAEGQLNLLRTEAFLAEGTDEAELELFPGYRFVQEVTEAELDGLYNVRVDIFHGTRDEPVYRLETLLFDPPASAPSGGIGGSLSGDGPEGAR